MGSENQESSTVASGQLQEIENEMKRIEEMQENEKEKTTTEQLWNIRFI